MGDALLRAVGAPVAGGAAGRALGGWKGRLCFSFCSFSTNRLGVMGREGNSVPLPVRRPSRFMVREH